MAGECHEHSWSQWESDSGYGSDDVLPNLAFDPDPLATESDEVLSPAAFAALIASIEADARERLIPSSSDAVQTDSAHTAWTSPHTLSTGSLLYFDEQRPPSLLLQGEAALEDNQAQFAPPTKQKSGFHRACNLKHATKAKTSGNRAKRGRPLGSRDSKPRKPRASRKARKNAETMTEREAGLAPKPVQLVSPGEWNNTPSTSSDSADGCNASIPARVHKTPRSFDGTVFRLAPSSTEKTYDIRRPKTAPPQAPYEMPDEHSLAGIGCNNRARHKGEIYLSNGSAVQLPGYEHTACHLHLTERCDFWRNNDLGLICTVCDHSASLSYISAPRQPHLVSTMVLRAQNLPLEPSMTQPIIIDQREASEILTMIYASITSKQAGAYTTGTRRIPPHAFLFELVDCIKEQEPHHLVTCQTLEKDLGRCIEKLVFERLLARTGHKYRKLKKKYLKHHRLADIIPELSRDEPGLEIVMVTWDCIIRCFAGLMALRLEQRF
ncbi:uncharacterized protein EKO05_0002628 [Ascochyta rabiei]|uniref:uncharacterized protein n=1 Tax=Didymella rabiei TaxID=5454 RepID=UPI00190041E2|nr:uncharacterized protein EKO05_0002628 [Ascochyta rabiei]UPX12051.1 hypothetical protein EKO05_0002628 [Ascochyta rabiei]